MATRTPERDQGTQGAKVMARHDKRGQKARGAEAHKRATPAAALNAEQEAEVAALLAKVPALADALRAAAPEGQAAQVACLADVQRASEPVQIAFATRLGDARGPAGRAAAEVANALGELAAAHEVARAARRARIRLRSTGALPTLDLAPSTVPEAPVAAPVVPDAPRLVEAHVGAMRDQGEVMVALAWQEGSDPDYVRGCSMALDFWNDGVRSFSITAPIRRARFLEDTVHYLQTEEELRTVPVTWAAARRLVLEALDVNTWRGTEPDADYRRNQRWIAARLLDVPDTDEARAEVAAEDARAAREGDRPYFSTSLEPDDLVATWIGMWTFGDFGGAYDLLGNDHPLHRGAARDEFVRQRRAWAAEARPAGLRLTLVREQAQRASALWVPGAAGIVAPGGRQEMEAFWSITCGESPLGGALEELPLASLTSPVTGRHWFWTAYTVERDAGGAWRITRSRDEGAASQALTVEELQRRVTEARAAAEKIIAAPPPDPRSEATADLLRELTGGLVTAMHYRDALSTRVPLDEALYHASIADAQVVRAYERAAALLERMRGRFPGEARTLFELGIQYYLVGMDVARAGDAGAEVLWLERAAGALRQAIEIEPSAEHLQALGEILARQGYYDQSVAQLRAAIALDPARASAHSDLADALMSSASDGNLDASVPVSRLDPAARERHVSEVARAALAELREALRLDPNVPAAYSRMGAIYDVLGQREDALLAFQEAVRHDPSDPEARYTLGTLYLQRNEAERALLELESAAQLDPSQVAIRVSLAATYAVLKRRREAERELDAVDAMRPGLPQVAELRAELAKLSRS
jgi:tetratricopeptide (TPR) repeat protein